MLHLLIFYIALIMIYKQPLYNDYIIYNHNNLLTSLENTR